MRKVNSKLVGAFVLGAIALFMAAIIVFGKGHFFRPTLSVVMDPADMFGAQGLYQNPQSEGDAWERPASAEWISPDGSEPGFRINCGIRIQGASSRNPDTPKHSMSLRFRSAYGAGKLRYDFFRDATAVEEFDLLQLRPEYNHGFVHRQYYRCDVA